MVTASFTLPTIERLNRFDILSKFLRENRSLGGYGTATGGSATTIVDTGKLKTTQAPTTDWVGGWARLAYDAGGAAAAPEGEIKPISAYAPSTGTITIDTYTTAVAVGDKYQLWRNPYPQDILDMLDDCLTQECYLPTTALLTEVPDGDMEQNHTTDWTGSSATLSKVTAEPAMNGARWLSVVNTGAGGFARPTTNISLNGNAKAFHLSALVRCSAASTTAELTAYDATNSAAIKTVTSTSRGNVRLWMEFTAPATCAQIQVRLGATENTVTTLWDDVCLMSTDSPTVPLPWWVRSPDQVKGIYRLQPISLSANHWGPDLRGTKTPVPEILDDGFGRGQLRAVAAYGNNLWPLYIKGTRNETAFANENTDYKHLDAKFVHACLSYKIFDSMSGYESAGELNMEWVKERAAYWRKEYETLRKAQSLRLERQETAPSRDVPIWRYPVDARPQIIVSS